MCQPTVRLPEVTKNANFALTMPFVQDENAIYAYNAIYECYTMPFMHTMPIVRTMPFVHASQCQLCIWRTIGIVAHLALWMALCDVILCSTMQYNEIACNTIQYNRIQFNNMQYQKGILRPKQALFACFWPFSRTGWFQMGYNSGGWAGHSTAMLWTPHWPIFETKKCPSQNWAVQI